jgi:hypothetical protein
MRKRKYFINPNRIYMSEMDPKMASNAPGNPYFPVNEKHVYVERIELDYCEYVDICQNLDWNLPNEMKTHISELIRTGAFDEFENEFLDKWGHTRENLAILRNHTQYYSSYFENYDNDTDNDGGLDDVDIIRRIQDGDGEMFGYG